MLSIVLVLSMVLGLASCGNKSDTEKFAKEKKFVCGITDYKPMNYKDEKGNWIGFDTEFAQAVAKKLGYDVEFVEIDWGSKYNELNSGKIDFIWNGFTYGNEDDGTPRTDYVDFSHEYLKNQQCVVVKAEDLEALGNEKALDGKIASVENGSSGVSVAKNFAGEKATLNEFGSQADALNDLHMDKSDFAVVDYQLAKAVVGQGDLSDLVIVEAIKLEPEVYAIGARKGSDFMDELNKAIEELSEDGTLAKLAKKYGLENDLIENIGK